MRNTTITSPAGLPIHRPDRYVRRTPGIQRLSGFNRIEIHACIEHVFSDMRTSKCDEI